MPLTARGVGAGVSVDVVSHVMLRHHGIMEPECWTRTHSQLMITSAGFTLSCTEISTAAALRLMRFQLHVSSFVFQDGTTCQNDHPFKCFYAETRWFKIILKHCFYNAWIWNGNLANVRTARCWVKKLGFRFSPVFPFVLNSMPVDLKAKQCLSILT